MLNSIIQSPPPLRGRVREGGSLSWPMNGHDTSAAIRRTLNKNFGLTFGAMHWVSASVASTPSANILSISSALIANSSSKPTAASMTRNVRRMMPLAPHGSKRRAIACCASGTTTFSPTSKVLSKSSARTSPLEGEAGTRSVQPIVTAYFSPPPLRGRSISKADRAGGTTPTAKPCPHTPSQPSPSRGEGFSNPQDSHELFTRFVKLIEEGK